MNRTYTITFTETQLKLLLQIMERIKKVPDVVWPDERSLKKWIVDRLQKAWDEQHLPK